MRMTEICKHYGASSLAQCPPQAFIYPEFFPKGSLLWTLERLDYLDTNTRETLCNELREVFLSKGSRAYGEHLLKRVRECGSSLHKKNAQSRKLPQAAQLPKGMQARVDRMMTRGSNKKSIIGMAEGAR